MGLLRKLEKFRRDTRDRVRCASSTRELQRLLSGVPEPVIFDVGANHGNVARKFRKRFPGSTVYCFEPFPETHASLVANTADDPRIKTFNFGLADHSGEQAFYSNTRPEANSLLASAAGVEDVWGAGVMETREVVEVALRTLDSVVEELGVPRIDLLKLDVQGAEHLVMLGAKATCDAGRIGVVFTEVITQPAYEGQQRFDQALGSYYDRGFDLHNMYTASLTEEGRIRYLDAIFTRDERRSAAA